MSALSSLEYLAIVDSMMNVETLELMYCNYESVNSYNVLNPQGKVLVLSLLRRIAAIRASRLLAAPRFHYSHLRQPTQVVPEFPQVVVEAPVGRPQYTGYNLLFNIANGGQMMARFQSGSGAMVQIHCGNRQFTITDGRSNVLCGTITKLFSGMISNVMNVHTKEAIICHVLLIDLVAFKDQESRSINK
ncbi:unnamed protein product, partial [Mesorhabditis belari]|uniref:Uncharacterized protein n=1 Tax=Mesorhabditis belari TaxID=2138241 RepID=A0AAF3J2S1_9BILA